MLANLFNELNQLSAPERACVVIDCLVNDFDLVPTLISLNYSRLLLNRSSDRLVEIFENDLLELTSEQRQQLGQDLLSQLWSSRISNRTRSTEGECPTESIDEPLTYLGKEDLSLIFKALTQYYTYTQEMMVHVAELPHLPKRLEAISALNRRVNVELERRQDERLEESDRTPNTKDE